MKKGKKLIFQDEDTELTGDGFSSGKKGSRRTTKRRKKSTAKPKQQFRKGICNPSIELLNVEEERESLKDSLQDGCCGECSNRNVVRAVLTNSAVLMQSCVESKDKITSLFDSWSPEISFDSFYYAVTTNNLNMITKLVKSKQMRLKKPAAHLIEYVSTGTVSYQAFSAHVRKVQLSRGNRQGNNAFLEKSRHSELHAKRGLLLKAPKVETRTIEKLLELEVWDLNWLYSKVGNIVASGNRKVASYVLDKVRVLSWNAFNDLHCDVLKLEGEELKEFESKKVCEGEKGVTAVHCACINPNEKYIKALYDAGASIHTPDHKKRLPIHYASACESSEPLHFLLERGGNPLTPDSKKRTALHYAAKYARPANIRLLIDRAPLLLGARDKVKLLPFHYACVGGSVEAVKAFVEKGAKVNVSAGADKIYPLGLAAAHNHYDVCEYLIDNKARVLSRDKFRRTALAMAVRNGNAKIANLLLRKGALWDDGDSSGNAPLHYAAAYGWRQCAEQLVGAGANANASNNWKITPLNIAMLKNHYGMVKYLLDRPGADVNCKDEKGRTLLYVALNLEGKEGFDYVKYLLEEKKADPNIPDINGDTPLSYLAKT